MRMWTIHTKLYKCTVVQNVSLLNPTKKITTRCPKLSLNNHPTMYNHWLISRCRPVHPNQEVIQKNEIFFSDLWVREDNKTLSLFVMFWSPKYTSMLAKYKMGRNFQHYPFIRVPLLCLIIVSLKFSQDKSRRMDESKYNSRGE